MEIKAAGSDLDWSISYTLAAGETITGSVWAVTPPGALSVKASTPAIAGPVTSCILTGGTLRRMYEVTNTATTSQGRVDVRTLTFRIGSVEAI